MSGYKFHTDRQRRAALHLYSNTSLCFSPLAEAVYTGDHFVGVELNAAIRPSSGEVMLLSLLRCIERDLEPMPSVASFFHLDVNTRRVVWESLGILLAVIESVGVPA